MFEISKLKEKKLSELQEIAEELKISKYKTLKKLDLVYKILDHQASNPDEKDVDKTEKRDSSKSKFKTRNRTNKNNPSDKKLNEDKDKTDKKPHNRDNRNRKPKGEPNGNRDTRNRYKEPDYEFDAIIESEGVLDIMQDGYGFLRSSSKY